MWTSILTTLDLVPGEVCLITYPTRPFVLDSVTTISSRQQCEVRQDSVAVPLLSNVTFIETRGWNTNGELSLFHTGRATPRPSPCNAYPSVLCNSRKAESLEN